MRSILCSFGIVAGLTVVAAGANAQERIPGCSRAAYTQSSAATLKACDELLALPALTDDERFRGLLFRARSLHRLGVVAHSKLDWQGKTRLYDDAIETYAKALKLRPDDTETHVRRGWMAFNTGDYERTALEVKFAAKGDPAWLPAVHVLEATIKGAVEGNLAAFGPIERAVAMAPDDPEVLFKAFQVNYTAGAHKNALKIIDRLLLLPPASITKPEQSVLNGRFAPYRVDAYLVRASALEQLGRKDEIEKTYDELVARDPSSMTFASRANSLRWAKARPERIKADIDRALALDPEDWFARRAYGSFLHIQHDFVGAAREYGHASRLRPGDGPLRWGYAQILRKTGRNDEAVVEAFGALRNGDLEFLKQKLGQLRKHGYLASESPMDGELRDAVLACTFDEFCQ